MYENDYSYCKAVYLGELKRFLKSGLDEHKFQSTVGKKIAIIVGSKRNFLIGKAD